MWNYTGCILWSFLPAKKKPNSLSKVGKRFNESMKDHSNQTQWFHLYRLMKCGENCSIVGMHPKVKHEGQLNSFLLPF
jgi:hypothetical protein